MKIGTPTPGHLWAIVFTLAVYGGLARYTIKTKGHNVTLRGVVSQMIISTFAGVMAALGMVEGSLSICAVYIAAGAAGFAGSEALNKFMGDKNVQVQPDEPRESERRQSGACPGSDKSATAINSRLSSDRRAQISTTPSRTIPAGQKQDDE